MANRYLNWLLSGGIGSGKSEVRRLLEGHGLMTIDADGIGHEVISLGGAVAGEVARRWPDAVVNGEIDRKRLGALVFADPAQLSELESITHPHIFGEIQRRVAEAVHPVIIEIPLLKNPFAADWPRVVVDAPDHIRKQRAVLRGDVPGDVEQRMAAQPSRSMYLAAADVVIPNSASRDDLESAVRLFVGVLVNAGV